MAHIMEHSMHRVIGLVLLVTGAFVVTSLLVTYSSAQGGDVNANVNIDNDPPIIQGHTAFQDPGDDGGATSFTFSPTPGGTLTHTLGGNTNVIVNVNVFDSNGWAAQPTNISMRLIRTTGGGTGAATGFTTVISNQAFALPDTGPVACTAIVNVSATERTFNCGINMKFVSDPTSAGSEVAPGINYQGEHWRALLVASDGINIAGDVDTVHFEWPNGIGFLAPSLVNLGSIATDGVPGTLAPLATKNLGNQQIDVTAQATELTDAAAWTCTGSGNPLISDVHLGPAGTDTNYAVMDPLNINGAAINHTDFDSARLLTEAEITFKPMYFQMATTQAITPGTCTLSSIVLSAIKGF